MCNIGTSIRMNSFSTGKIVVRRKVIIAPFISPGHRRPPKFLVVKDRKFQEWTFVTGGCKHSETDVQAAQRELKEETRGLVNVDLGSLPHIRFVLQTTHREEKELRQDAYRGEKVLTTYTVFIVDFTNHPRLEDRQDSLRSMFHDVKNCKGVYNENVDIDFETLENFVKKPRVWHFIKMLVLKNRMFKEACEAVVNAYKDSNTCEPQDQTPCDSHHESNNEQREPHGFGSGTFEVC